MIKARIGNSNTTPQSCIYYYKIIGQRHYTAMHYTIIHFKLLLIHRFVIIVFRMDFYCIEALPLSSCNYALIRLYVWRVAPITHTFIWI